MATQNLTRNARLCQKKGVRVFATMLDYADTSELDIQTSADDYELFVAPNDCYVTKAELFVLTAFDSATSAVANVGLDGGDTLIDGADLTSAADSVLSGGTNAVVPQFLETGGTITFSPAYTGATTEGKVLMIVEYVEINRREEGELTNFSTTT
jgi:hypothetical protein